MSGAAAGHSWPRARVAPYRGARPPLVTADKETRYMAIREATLAGLSREQLLALHYQMSLIRQFEEKAAEAYTLGKIGGFLHLYIGQEATGVGAISALRPTDYVLSSYREHGHAIAKGGSMHMYSAEHRLLGGQAIVGAQIVMATGIGFGIQYQEQSDIALTFFGDGAVDEGAFHEALNLTALWKLPVVYLCENNGYSMGMNVKKAWSVASLRPRVAAYGMPYLQVDGMDLLVVRAAVTTAAETARSGGGPTLIEAVSYRYRGHSMADPARYRTREEEAQWKANRDPIQMFEAKLTEAGLARDEDLSASTAR